MLLSADHRAVALEVAQLPVHELPHIVLEDPLGIGLECRFDIAWSGEVAQPHSPEVRPTTVAHPVSQPHAPERELPEDHATELFTGRAAAGTFRRMGGGCGGFSVHFVQVLSR